MSRNALLEKKVSGKTKMSALALILMLLSLVLSVVTISAKGHDMEGQKKMNKKSPAVEHPIKKPKMYSKVKHCDNCGMMVNMWARTRHAFKHPEGDLTTCSIRCLADKQANSGKAATDVQVALYMEPEKMIPATDATYVIDSGAKGTMTMHSKIAFSRKKEAEKFRAKFGGTVIDYEGALKAATVELPKSTVMIDKNRKRTGKIKPVKHDAQCVVCKMSVAKQLRHDSQILQKDNTSLHFCSTQCLINYKANPGQYVKKPGMSKMIWAKVYPGHDYESAVGLYFVVGSRVFGPMGKEAIAFREKKAAEELVAKEGGNIVSYKELVPSMVTN